MNKIKLGISACLVGQKTRYDGADKLDRFLVETLGQFAEFVPICPEVECGLSVPREAMCLVGSAKSPRLVTISTRQDLTLQMQMWAARRVHELESAGLHGFIFKARSPSCGVLQVPLYSAQGDELCLEGVGLFARAIIDHFPTLPIAEDERLHNPEFLKRFLARASSLAGCAPPTIAC